jgi:hypothetical protein
MGGRPEWYSVFNRYDTRGRIRQLSIRAPRFQGEVEIAYNEHGDRESEIGQGSQSDPNNAAPSPSYSETHYSYQYDQHDNWIEKVESCRSSPDGPFHFSSTVLSGRWRTTDHFGHHVCGGSR